MLDRFTSSAREAMGRAKAEATDLRHDYISTEHILLSLLKDQHSKAFTLLMEMLGEEVSELEKRLRSLMRPGTETPRGAIPFTPGAKRALETAVHVDLELEAGEINTQHLLVGIAAAKETARQTLAEFDVTEDVLLERLGAQASQLLHASVDSTLRELAKEEGFSDNQVDSVIHIIATSSVFRAELKHFVTLIAAVREG